MSTIICSYCQYVGQGNDDYERIIDVEHHEETCSERPEEEFRMKNLLFKVLKQILVNQMVILENLTGEDSALNGTVRTSSCNLIGEIENASNAIASNKSRIDWKAGDTAEIKEGWDRAGDYLKVLAPAIFLKQWWVPVDDPEDYEKGPTYHKEAGLERVQ